MTDEAPKRASQPEEEIGRIKGMAHVGAWPRPEQMIGPVPGEGERRAVLPGGQNRPSEQDDRQKMQAETDGAAPIRAAGARQRAKRKTAIPARDRRKRACIATAVLSRTKWARAPHVKTPKQAIPDSRSRKDQPSMEGDSNKPGSRAGDELDNRALKQPSDSGILMKQYSRLPTDVSGVRVVLQFNFKAARTWLAAARCPVVFSS